MYIYWLRPEFMICQEHYATLRNLPAKKIIKAIINNEHESRKTWMIEIFRQAGQTNSRNDEYQFWRQDNQPKECYSPSFTIQKLNYIHNNPVEAGLVDKAEEYVYSSARDYYHQKNCGLLDVTCIWVVWSIRCFPKVVLSHRLSRAFEESYVEPNTKNSGGTEGRYRVWAILLRRNDESMLAFNSATSLSKTLTQSRRVLLNTEPKILYGPIKY